MNFYHSLELYGNTSVQHSTRSDTSLFCLYLYTFHFLWLKQKMDSLLFVIKKHN